MNIGKLYRLDGKRFVANVKYQLYEKSPTSLWGELILDEFKPVPDGEGYAIELENKSKCQCNLKKRVNRAVSGVPPRYVYHFSGSILTSG